jgi:hypothetical protein
VKDHDIAVRITKGGEMAGSRVPGLGDELHALCLEPGVAISQPQQDAWLRPTLLCEPSTGPSGPGLQWPPALNGRERCRSRARYGLTVAKFRCVCGEIIRTSGEIPNPIEWHALSDVDFDAFQGQVDAEEIYLRTTIFYRCPKSDHLWVFWDGIDSPPQVYTPTAPPG